MKLICSHTQEFPVSVHAVFTLQRAARSPFADNRPRSLINLRYSRPKPGEEAWLGTCHYQRGRFDVTLAFLGSYPPWVPDAARQAASRAKSEPVSGDRRSTAEEPPDGHPARMEACAGSARDRAFCGRGLGKCGKSYRLDLVSAFQRFGDLRSLARNLGGSEKQSIESGMSC